MYVGKSWQTKGKHCEGKKHRIKKTVRSLLTAAGIYAVSKKIAAHHAFCTKREIQDICLAVCGEHIWLKGLVDTGNCLYDGTEKKPVCVMDKNVMKRQLPALEDKLQSYLREGVNDERLGLHYLAFCSLGCPDGIALVFTAEYLVVQKNRSKRKTMHPHIAVADSSLLFGRAYQIILNPDVLRKREE